MPKLTHFRLCPRSRAIRIALAELGLEAELVEEQPWRWRPVFLALNPAGELPVLEIEDGPVVCGVYAISEYLADKFKSNPRDGRAAPLFSGDTDARAEIRRLADWFVNKFDREITRELLYEKVYAQMQHGATATPDPEILRAVRANLRYHLSYIGYLADQRRWLAGDELSFADIAAAAQISSVDYLGEVPWDQFASAKSWYARIKSRPAFRAILNDRVPGTIPPLSYGNLDF